jgi:hypothetical protein
MNRFFAVVFFLVPLPALAEDITVSIGAVSETWTLSSEDQQRFDQWVQTAYKCPIPPPIGAPAPCTPVNTLAESQLLWAKSTLQGTINNVERHHKAIAAGAAVGNVTPITPVSEKSTPAPTKGK